MDCISTFLVLLTAVVCDGVTIENNTATYDPGDLLSKIFNGIPSPSARQAGYGLIRFEGEQSLQNQNQGQYGLVTFDGQSSQNNRPFIEDQNSPENAFGSPIFNANPEQLKPANGQVTFQDDNRIEGNRGQKKRKRRRRRKPRVQRPGFPVANYLGQQPGFGPQQVPNVPGYPGGQFYRPPRRPPSIASDALAAVTGALTSIALYDDYQCVPRLLCEAAGGGSLGAGSGILQSISGIQPLLTLLAAYNGISTSPLFVFGRAVFLGMTSKANPGTCRYAYPLCPTDPEQLVHYLNNHNGGFFRFFSAPQQGQQNLEQFYNQFTVPGQYGLQSNDQNQQNYGLYSNVNQANYGLQRAGLYNGAHPQQGYGLNFPHNQNQYGNPFRYTSNNDNDRNKIQKRIQNNKHSKFMENDFDTGDQSSKWLFPERLPDNKFEFNKVREDRNLKFPEENDQTTTEAQSFNRKSRGFNFPGIQSNRAYTDNYPPLASTFNNNLFQLDTYTNADSQRMYKDDIETIYVVRGNGDPNNPEIIKVRAGETLQ